MPYPHARLSLPFSAREAPAPILRTKHYDRLTLAAAFHAHGVFRALDAEANGHGLDHLPRQDLAGRSRAVHVELHSLQRGVDGLLLLRVQLLVRRLATRQADEARSYQGQSFHRLAPLEMLVRANRNIIG
jgi:hypothetical protein